MPFNLAEILLVLVCFRVLEQLALQRKGKHISSSGYNRTHARGTDPIVAFDQKSRESENQDDVEDSALVCFVFNHLG